MKSMTIEPIQYPGSASNFRAWMDRFVFRSSGKLLIPPSQPINEILKTVSWNGESDIIDFTQYYRQLQIIYSEENRSSTREVWHIILYDPLQDKNIKPPNKWGTILAAEQYPGKTVVEFWDGLYYRLDTRFGIIDFARGEMIGEFLSSLAKFIKDEIEKELNTNMETESWHRGETIYYDKTTGSIIKLSDGRLIRAKDLSWEESLNQTSKTPSAVILTALPIEYKAVREHLIDLREETHPQGTVYEKGTFSSASCSWDIGIVEIGQGNPAAAMEAERAINYFNPDIVLFVGVAGGIKDVQLGDVVAGTKVYGYESGKDNELLESRPEIGNSTYRMEQRARAEAKKNGWLQRIKRPSPTQRLAPRVFVGPIAAGEKVVASIMSNTYNFIRKQYGDALAVEMEGYGFLTAIHANSGVDALVVRGVSDLISDKGQTDAKGWQEVAAQNASAFAFEVLSNITFPYEGSIEHA